MKSSAIYNLGGSLRAMPPVLSLVVLERIGFEGEAPKNICKTTHCTLAVNVTNTPFSIMLVTNRNKKVVTLIRDKKMVESFRQNLKIWLICRHNFWLEGCDTPITYEPVVTLDFCSSML